MKKTQAVIFGGVVGFAIYFCSKFIGNRLGIEVWHVADPFGCAFAAVTLFERTK